MQGRYACAELLFGESLSDDRPAHFMLASVTRSSNSFGYDRRNKHTNMQMLHRAWAALPLTRIRERAFEGAFFSVALIAMAGWVYFITLLLVRMIMWIFA
jgi:hypothetical protein